ncbi:MAG: hypothetical protein RIG62_18325 [Cyclobacteriaceae bacterium]
MIHGTHPLALALLFTIPLLLLLTPGGQCQGNGQKPAPTGGNGIKLDELKQSTAEFVLNLQKVGVINVGIDLITKHNAELILAYQTFNDIKDGSFSIRELILEDMLKVVKSEISNHTKVLETIDLIVKIRQEINRAKSIISDTDLFTAVEKELFLDSYTECARQASTIAWQVGEVIREGDMRLNDGERLELVYRFHMAAETLYLELRKFNQMMNHIALIRLDTQMDQLPTILGK